MYLAGDEQECDDKSPESRGNIVGDERGFEDTLIKELLAVRTFEPVLPPGE